ncbi:hypothetical protein M438DRAFT_385272 [Aureobasidium pullulans EXF-150]|uniref:Uncharacterized protein n=1 Tax=Aureobasidium pullulans EXF-150 TaxID=1043002 RepID=A0A074XAU1_AURPU|nr:uncharacterized protein M438DRAFT_385272 [Aureobasidium pullulans EXF-150]KEQ80859.1 hypothetical protein M438DRAFT_385272 [Aureobasidium pullulans EXF-150]
MMSKHLNPSPNFFFFTRTLAYRCGHASTCQLQLDKAPVWWAEQAPNNPAAIENRGIRSGRGAIALS